MAKPGIAQDLAMEEERCFGLVLTRAVSSAQVVCRALQQAKQRPGNFPMEVGTQAFLALAPVGQD
jgi:hypothetical protein